MARRVCEELGACPVPDPELTGREHEEPASYNRIVAAAARAAV